MAREHPLRSRPEHLPNRGPDHTQASVTPADVGVLEKHNGTMDMIVPRHVESVCWLNGRGQLSSLLGRDCRHPAVRSTACGS